MYDVVFVETHATRHTKLTNCAVTPWSNLYGTTVKNRSGIPLRKDMIERELHISMNKATADLFDAEPTVG